MRLWFVFVSLLVAACSQSDAAEPVVREHYPLPEVFQEKARPWIESDIPTEPLPPKPVVEEDAPEGDNPYKDWASRCEPMDYARTCQVDADCKDVEHPADAVLECMQPWWSDAKVCSPGWSDRAERQWRRDRLKVIVKEQYFALTIAGLPQHKKRQWSAESKADALSNFLWLVYARETTGRPWKRHRLNGDVKVAKTDWSRQAERYGWSATPTKDGTVQMAPCTDCEASPSPYYPYQTRWMFGLGPYGQIAPLWAATWDPQAPPEILCGEVEATETYLRGARRVWRKLRGGIQCDGELYQPDVTWEVIHRGVAGGKLCPGKSSEDFRRRAQRLGLDPDQTVTLDMLGTPIPVASQNYQAQYLYALLDTELPPPSDAGS
jgi:hypothetical protein